MTETTTLDRPHDDKSDDRIGELGWVALLCVICLIILFANLGSAGLFEPDEGRNAEKAREILLLGDWITPHHNFLPTLDKPISYYWPVAGAFNLFGLTEWAARLPSALAALGCLFLLYDFTRRKVGVSEALWSCLILATCVEFFVFSRLVIFDMTLTFFLTMALLSFYSAISTDDRRASFYHSMLMYAAVAAGTLVKGAIAVVLPGMVIFAYLLITGRWNLLARLRLGSGLLVFVAIAAPWYLLAESRNPGYLKYFFWEEHFVRYTTEKFDRSRGWYYFFIVVAAGFFPWSFLLPQAMRDLWRRRSDSLSLFLMVWALLPFVFFSLSGSQLPQYILPIFPALAMITGTYVSTNCTGSAIYSRNAIILPWTAVLLCTAYLLTGSVWTHLLAPQVRTAAGDNAMFVAVCGVLLLSIFLVALYRSKRFPSQRRGVAYVSTAVGFALFFLLVGKMMVAVSAERGSRQLAQAADSFIDRADRVAFYDSYLAGVPFYLRRSEPVWIVQHRERERVMGSNYLAEKDRVRGSSGGQVIYSFSEFARQWTRPGVSIKAFVKAKNLARLSSEVGTQPRILTSVGEYLLVSNR